MGQDTDRSPELTQALLKRDLEEIKRGVQAIQDKQDKMDTTVSAQALTCARNCAAAEATRKAMSERIAANTLHCQENEKRLNQMLTGNTVLSAVVGFVTSLISGALSR